MNSTKNKQRIILKMIRCLKWGIINLKPNYAGEGHTKDNIVIWFGRHKILYGGCLIKSTESKDMGNIADANPQEWKPTIKKVLRKYPRPKYVIPGHYGWSSNKGLQHTLKLLESARQ